MLFQSTNISCLIQSSFFNPFALRKAKIACNFGFSGCSRVKCDNGDKQPCRCSFSLSVKSLTNASEAWYHFVIFLSQLTWNTLDVGKVPVLILPSIMHTNTVHFPSNSLVCKVPSARISQKMWPYLKGRAFFNLILAIILFRISKATCKDYDNMGDPAL